MRYYSSSAVATTLTGAVNSSAAVVAVASVAGFPTQYPWTAILDKDTSNEEVVTVSGVAGLNVTLSERGADGTTASAHSAGGTLNHGFSGRDFQEPQNHMNASSNVHGTGSGSSVVGTTSIQTLTNKTLTQPTIVDYTLANHDHGDVDSGGVLPQASVTGLPAAIATATALAPLAAAWTAFTPTWTATSGTNPVIGNGTISGRYVSVGKLVIYELFILMGSTTTFGSTGPYAIGLTGLPTPVAPGRRVDGGEIRGSVSYPTWLEFSSGSISGTPRYLSTPAINTPIGLTSVTPSVPTAFAAGDAITFQGFYEAV